MENLGRDKEYERSRSNEERLSRTAERTDLILTRLSDLTTKEVALKENVRDLENRLETIESRQNEILECVRQITSSLPAIMNAIQPRGISPAEGVLRPDYSDFDVGVLREQRLSVSREDQTASPQGSQSRMGETPGPPMHSLSYQETFSAPAARRYRTATITGKGW